MIEITNDKIRQLLKGSAFEGLSNETLQALVANHQVIEVPTGAAMYHEEDRARLTLVIEGLLRVWIVSADGRELTIRYAHTGELLGVPTVLIGPAPVRVSAISACRLCYFQADTVRALAAVDPQVALALARESSYNLFDLIDRLHNAVFGTIRQKLARHLIDLATDRGDAKVAVVTVQELAMAIGSVREVVSRALSEMRREGLITSSNGAVELVDPVGLRDAIGTHRVT